jgi:hypothetical protein
LFAASWKTIAAAAWSCALLGAQTARAQEEEVGCTRDVDCKGERICEAGACVYPTEPMSTPVESAPQALPATPPAQPMVTTPVPATTPSPTQAQPVIVGTTTRAAAPSDVVEETDPEKRVLAPHDFTLRIGYSMAAGAIPNGGLLAVGARMGESRHILQGAVGVDSFFNGGGVQLVYGGAYREDHKDGQGFSRILIGAATAFGGGMSATGLALRGDLLFATSKHSFMGFGSGGTVIGGGSLWTVNGLLGF